MKNLALLAATAAALALAGCAKKPPKMLPPPPASGTADAGMGQGPGGPGSGGVGTAALPGSRADFIAAVRLTGASGGRIVLRHVAPLCLPSLVVRVTLDMSSIILTAAGLGFLGMGAQPPSPEWGAMISVGWKYLLDYWWYPTFPGLALFLASGAFNLIGDGIRDILDPKSN